MSEQITFEPTTGEQEPYDVIIIGAGPAGASAAIYAARADLNTLVLDKGLRTGALGLASKIANYPGVPEQISGEELVQRIRDQAARFGAQFLQEKVLGTFLEGESKSVQSANQFYQGRAVIIASGSMGRTHTVDGEERLTGRGVSYCATCDGPFFRDEVVAVAGNNDEALEETLLLTRFVEQAHLVVPTPDFNADPALVEEVQAHPKVEVHMATRLSEVLGEAQVTGVRILPRGEGERTLPVGGVFIFLQGGQPITDFVGDQLPTTEEGCLQVDELFQTAIPGVFAVGDVLCKHLKQAVIAAAEGAAAAMAVQRYLSGREKLRPDWS